MAKVFQSMDGNQAAAYISYAFTEVAGIYPITPSSPMGDHVDRWSAQGKKNLFGIAPRVVEMQSEAGAAGAVHGSLQTGSLTTTYTSSQGLLLKIPNMYKISGQLLPGVMHVAARSIAQQSLSIFGDHQDIYAARQTGWAMLATSSVQEVMDMAGIAHLAAIKTRVPFMHFFDGFRTSHEIQKVEVMDYSVLDRLLDRKAVTEFRKSALNPSNPITRGSAQNDDVYFQAAEAQNRFWDAIPDVVNDYMKEISKETGRHYAPFVYYGHPEATDIIIAMGSVNETAKEVIDVKMTAGEKVGLLTVHLYRPFSEKYFYEAIPTSVERIAVLDRTKEKGALGEPLYLDVRAVFYGRENAPKVIGGRYGLSSKDVTPEQIGAVYTNLKNESSINGFTIGIIDDVTFKSLADAPHIQIEDQSLTELLFFGLGSDGTVGASKNTINIISENTDLYGQSYASYDSKKSGGVTRMHLRFGKSPIRSTYMVSNPHFVSCSSDSYITKYDLIGGLRPGGTFLLNTIHSEDEILAMMPNEMKRILAEKNADFFIINAHGLAKELGLGGRINTIMQSAFFKLNEQIIPYAKAKDLMKAAAKKSYTKRGEEVVQMNYDAIDQGGDKLVQIKVDPAWKQLITQPVDVDMSRPAYVRDLADPVNAIKGYDIPVSAFTGLEDGRMINGSAAYEKRAIATEVPNWLEDNCIQCNQCAFSCPHAVIRPFLSTADQTANAPAGSKTLKAVGKAFDGYDFSIQVSTFDCTGCGVCAAVCPGKNDLKALEMTPIEEMMDQGQHDQAAYFFNEVGYQDQLADKFANVKNSQFAQPLFEFSGACAGCGETPYIKLATQLYGDHMTIANATGCSSIYGGSFPATPYTTNPEGNGPAWANSLFEDNAEFGFGMHLSNQTLRRQIEARLLDIKEETDNEELIDLIDTWVEHKFSTTKTREVSPRLIEILETYGEKYAGVLDLKDFFVKSSTWIFGGDGWAYDIGYGGLDHVIANNEDVNILVLDTEVYSNTGGQSSKSSQSGSISVYTSAGKPAKKKDLAAIAMTYGHVYVAQVSHGASHPQTLKAFKEAESYNGPSIIVAYSPCIAHGISGGMTQMFNHANLATKCGYWPTFRFDPRLVEEGKNPFQIDCKEPQWDLYHEFLMSQTRYAALTVVNPSKAEELLALNQKDAKDRWKMYKRYQAMDWTSPADSPEEAAAPTAA
jgi:pyruvate-ferredoxin/flavodoxin oxidoreductase